MKTKYKNRDIQLFSLFVIDVFLLYSLFRLGLVILQDITTLHVLIYGLVVSLITIVFSPANIQYLILYGNTTKNEKKFYIFGFTCKISLIMGLVVIVSPIFISEEILNVHIIDSIIIYIGLSVSFFVNAMIMYVAQEKVLSKLLEK